MWEEGRREGVMVSVGGGKCGRREGVSVRGGECGRG